MVAVRRIACSLLILVLFCAAAGSSVRPESTGMGRIQPQLARLAVQEPDRLVSVIVQVGDRLQARFAIENLGGSVTRDLSLIQALVAEIPAGETPALAASPAVRWVSLDAPVLSSAKLWRASLSLSSARPLRASAKEVVETPRRQSPGGNQGEHGDDSDSKRKDRSAPTGDPSGKEDWFIDLSSIGNSFNQAVRAADLWNEAPGYTQGSGVTVAVIDSGSFHTSSLGNRLVGQLNFNEDVEPSNDRYGHGTFITALIAADGSNSAGRYIGVAPRANVISLRISDDTGRSNESDVISAMQWVYDNHTAYNIRVVNLSLNSSVMQSYHNSPLCAAAEVLWANGILVVAAAGNSGISGMYPPGNDPFVITVGAVDDRGTPGLEDDGIASFSAFGKTELGTTKPELVAPGVDLIAYLPDHRSLAISQDHPENRVTEDYFRMSGTSVAAALVSGAAALLFEASPHLTPDQAKYRLMASANRSWLGYSPEKAGAGYLDAYAAVKRTDTQNANEGLLASRLLWDGNDPLIWGNVAWGSVSWGSVAWGSVAWGSVAWGSDYWSD